jgi:hypothetical protein
MPQVVRVGACRIRPGGETFVRRLGPPTVTSAPVTRPHRQLVPARPIDGITMRDDAGR